MASGEAVAEGSGVSVGSDEVSELAVGVASGVGVSSGSTDGEEDSVGSVVGVGLTSGSGAGVASVEGLGVPSGGAGVVCSVGTGVGVPTSPSDESAKATKLGNNINANVVKKTKAFNNFLFFIFHCDPPF